MSIADLANTLEVAWRWRRAALRRAADGFGDERDDRFGAQFYDFVLEFGCEPQTICFCRLALAAVTVGLG